MSSTTLAAPSPSFLNGWALVIGNEGAYSNNPADPGGETMYGITERVARKWGFAGPMIDLPLSTAQQIGYAEYWQPNQLDKLDSGVAAQVFDGIYNSGADPAVKWLQISCRAFPDGVVGPDTIAAANAIPPARLIGRYDARRLLFLANLEGEWPTFGRGWARRIANNLLAGEKG